MDIKNKMKLLVASILLIGSGSSYALGTASGVTINNTATLDYSVSGVAQTAIVSNTASFVVDNKVNMTITPQATYTTVVPGATARVTSYLLANTGNTTQDYALTVNGSLASGTVVYTLTDNFNVTACVAYQDENSNGTYEPATDTRLYVDELAADATRTVFAVCNIPNTQINNDFSAVSMSARASVGGTANTQGAVTTQTATAKVLGTVAVVFADVAGTDDASRDGIFSARSGYLVSTAALTVTKAVAAFCDPFNFNNNPKLIPGGYARYTISVLNAVGAAASATLTSVTDTLVAQLTFDPNLNQAQAASCTTPESAAGSGLKISCVGGTRACVTTPIYVPTASVLTGQNINATLSTLLPAEAGYTAGELKAGERVDVIFNAIVN